MVGTCLSLWQIAVVASLCTALNEAFDPFPVDDAGRYLARRSDIHRFFRSGILWFNVEHAAGGWRISIWKK